MSKVRNESGRLKSSLQASFTLINSLLPRFCAKLPTSQATPESHCWVIAVTAVYLLALGQFCCGSLLHCTSCCSTSLPSLWSVRYFSGLSKNQTNSWKPNALLRELENNSRTKVWLWPIESPESILTSRRCRSLTETRPRPLRSSCLKKLIRSVDQACSLKALTLQQIQQKPSTRDSSKEMLFYSTLHRGLRTACARNSSKLVSLVLGLGETVLLPAEVEEESGELGHQVVREVLAGRIDEALDGKGAIGGVEELAEGEQPEGREGREEGGEGGQEREEGVEPFVEHVSVSNSGLNQNMSGFMTEEMLLEYRKEKEQYSYPALYSKAQYHASTTSSGPVKEREQPCPCCSKKPREVLNCAFLEPETYEKGAGVAAFFRVYQFLVGMMLIKFLLGDLPRIVNSPGHEADATIWERLSLTKAGYDFNAQPFNLATVVILLGMCFLMRRMQILTDYDADNSKFQESDFALFVTDIPLAFDGMERMDQTLKQEFTLLTAEVLREFKAKAANELTHEQGLVKLEMEWSDAGVVKVVSCYNISILSRIDAIVGETANNAILVLAQETQPAAVKEQSRLIKSVLKAKRKVLNSFRNGESLDYQVCYFAGKAFVSFSHREVRNFVLEHYRDNHEFWKIQGVNVKLSRADNPTNILWENMHYSHSDVLFRRVAAALGVVLVLSYAVVLLVVCQKLKQDYNEDFVVGTVLSATVSIMNFVIDLVIRYSVDYGKRLLVTDSKATYASYSFFAKLANTAIMPFMVQLLVYHNYFGGNGLAAYICSLVVINLAITLFMYVFLPATFVSKFVKGFLISLKAKPDPLDGNSAGVFQRTLNQFHEWPEFPIEAIYTSNLNIFVTTLFYSPLCPFLSLIAAAQFFLQLFVHRFNYAFRFTVRNEVTIKLSWVLTSYFELGVVMFALGNFVFPRLAGWQQNEAIVFVEIGLATLYFLALFYIPSQKMHSMFLPRQSQMHQFYHKASQKFTETYEQTNPAYQ